ncbi:MAG: hypothetical protein JW990_13495 [Thermoleophilia bacterium]|nr:hypothetical protein [Thermoleophilia bacterium]
MAKAVYLCTRDTAEAARYERRLEALAPRLAPDNITPSPPLILADEGIALAVYSPNETISVHGDNICLGPIFEQDVEWWRTSSETPDGTYAMFRGDAGCVEAVTDVLASRTIWYYHDENVFIASTSQRAIVFLTGCFDFNRSVIPWMLSTGTLGLGLSWDTRIHWLPGDSILTLDRNSWHTSLATRIRPFSPVDRSPGHHESLLLNALHETVAAHDHDFQRWIVPLSGGVDSRGILSLLVNRGARPHTLTWGLRDSMGRKGNDASIAREVARQYDLKHTYHALDAHDPPAAVIFDRFITQGEGRIDEIAGYVDGFAVWKHLHDSGAGGIVRGDEVFGYPPMTSVQEVLRYHGQVLWSDFAGVKSLEELGLPPQEAPEILSPSPGESLSLWRDRLCQAVDVQFGLSALNDLKLSYVEVTNPLLARRVVDLVRTLPDEERDDKRLWTRIVRSIGPEIDFAEHDAIGTIGGFLRSPAVVELLQDELSSQTAASVLPAALLEDIVTNMVVQEPKQGRAARHYAALRRFPGRARNRVSRALRGTEHYFVGYNRLALRAFIICKTTRLLHEDAAAVSAVHEA